MKKILINCFYLSTLIFIPQTFGGSASPKFRFFKCLEHTPCKVAEQPTPSTKPPLNQRPPTEDAMREEEEVPSSDRSRYEKHDYHDHRHDQDFRHYRYNDDQRYPHRYHHDYDDFDGSFESY